MGITGLFATGICKMKTVAMICWCMMSGVIRPKLFRQSGLIAQFRLNNNYSYENTRKFSKSPQDMIQ